MIADNQSSPIGELLTIDQLHQFAYCPRRMHLMHVEGRWADNAFTLDGKQVHRRVDQVDQVLPDPTRAEPAAVADSAATGGDESPEISRSVSLSSELLGLTAKLDLVSTAGDEAVALERKRGKVPNNPERSWEPERVQLMAQGLLLREHGYRCDHGMLYFAGSRTRVVIPFSADLEARTRALIDEARAAMDRTTAPPPLEDSPKCHGCSLAGICLPDETAVLLARAAESAPPPLVRRLYPVRDDALPLYIQTQGATVGKNGSCLVVRKEGEELAKAHLKDISQLVLCGNIMVTAQTFHLLCERGIPIVHLSSGNWFYGVTYDISDDKRRNEVFRLLEGNGDHVQYSVFYCELNEQERVLVEGGLTELIHHDEDQILILDLGQGAAPLESALRTLGKSYVPPCRVQVV